MDDVIYSGLKLSLQTPGTMLLINKYIIIIIIIVSQ